MEVTIVGLPYYGYNNLKNTIVEGRVVSLSHDVANVQSKTAVVIKFGTVKIGYITGRESEAVLKVVNTNFSKGLQTLAMITEVRASCLKAKLEEYKNNTAYVFSGYSESTTPILCTKDFVTKAEDFVTKADLNSQHYMKKEEPTMFEKIVNTNVTMAQSAAFLEAGRIANNTAAKFVASKAPLMIKGYVETAFGKLMIANAAAVAAEKFRPADKKLARLANAMITEAYQEVYQQVDIEKMLNEMLSSESVKSALAKLDTTNEAA
jgi:hypothetical protein